MTDLEMTKLCAEALRGDDKSIAIIVADGHVWNQWDDGSWAQNPQKFDPLHNDYQAMALVKKLGLTIDPEEDEPPFTWRVVVALDGDWDKQIEAHGTDLNRAIVECAAKLQQQKSIDATEEKP